MAASAPLTSSSGGPSRTSLSRLNVSAADGVLFNAARFACKDADELAARRFGGLALPLASELALCLWGDRLRAWRRVGEMSLECTSRSFCWVSTVDELLVILEAAPRLCADWSLRKVLWVRGVRGLCSSTLSEDGVKKEGIVSLGGLGMFPLSVFAFRENRSLNFEFERGSNC